MTWEELRTHELVVYSTAWCPDCRRLKQHLDRQGVKYREIDIDRDAAAADKLRHATGRTAIPFVEISGRHLVRGWHDEHPGRWDEELFLSEVGKALSAR